MILEFLLGFCTGALFVACIMVYKEVNRIEKSIRETLELLEKIEKKKKEMKK